MDEMATVILVVFVSVLFISLSGLIRRPTAAAVYHYTCTSVAASRGTGRRLRFSYLCNGDDIDDHDQAGDEKPGLPVWSALEVVSLVWRI